MKIIIEPDLEGEEGKKPVELHGVVEYVLVGTRRKPIPTPEQPLAFAPHPFAYSYRDPESLDVLIVQLGTEQRRLERLSYGS